MEYGHGAHNGDDRNIARAIRVFVYHRARDGNILEKEVSTTSGKFAFVKFVQFVAKSSPDLIKPTMRFCAETLHLRRNTVPLEPIRLPLPQTAGGCSTGLAVAGKTGH